MIELELDQAVAQSTRNLASRWPERGAANRLEPECWPQTSPRFRLEPGARVFTIGSCFARNVEQHLAGLGFDVPTRRFLDENIAAGTHGGDEILNKYTPPSIFQELAWTRAIMERGGEVRDTDIEPLLLDLGGGRVVDLQHRLTNQHGIARDEALKQRCDLYRLFENAFDSDLVIVTLGLIECWFDRTSGQYIEFGPHLRKHNDGNRFVFRRLTFAQAYDHTRKAIDLLCGSGPRNVLITTSPVPLARTFTGDDVIVANAYSKSVLRAVAGQIAEEYPNVDYFPSFESVMLTKQSYVWANDLVHVEGEFVGRIVGRMCERYVEGEGKSHNAAAHDAWLHFANLVGHRRFDEAETLLAGLNLTYAAHSARLSLAVAELRLHRGERDAALGFARQAQEKAEQAGERGCLDLLRIARIFDAAGLAEEAKTLRGQAVAALGNPGLVMSLLRRLAVPETMDDALRIVAHVERNLAGNLDLLAFAAQTFELLGDFAAAARLCRTALQSHPDDAGMLARLARLLLRRKKPKRAAALLEKALARNADDVAILKSLVATYRTLEKLEDEERCARLVVALAAGDASAHLDLASVLRRSGRRRDALEHARRAAALEPENERYARYVDELTSRER